VTVIGATNRPDGMDAALRRAGRFDREIMLGIPDEAARARILAVQARKLRLAGGLDLVEIAKKTPGYVGADLSALAKEAAALAVARIFKQLASASGLGSVAGTRAWAGAVDGPLYKPLGGGLGLGLGPKSGQPVIAGGKVVPAAGAGAGAMVAGGSLAAGSRSGYGAAEAGLMGTGRLADRRPFEPSELTGLAITDDDFTQALTRVQPSAQREGFTTTPEVTWEDVGSLTEVRGRGGQYWAKGCGLWVQGSGCRVLVRSWHPCTIVTGMSPEPTSCSFCSSPASAPTLSLLRGPRPDHRNDLDLAELGA
jgi:ribosome biogenesis ATPase